MRLFLIFLSALTIFAGCAVREDITADADLEFVNWEDVIEIEAGSEDYIVGMFETNQETAQIFVSQEPDLTKPGEVTVTVLAQNPYTNESIYKDCIIRVVE